MDYLSVKETAQYWGVTERRVQQLCKEGLIPGVTKLGKAWMIPKDAKLSTEEDIVRKNTRGGYRLTFRMSIG